MVGMAKQLLPPSREMFACHVKLMLSREYLVIYPNLSLIGLSGHDEIYFSILNQTA